MVLIRKNRFSNYSKKYKNEYTMMPDTPTDGTNILLAKSRESIKNIFTQGFEYKKIEVMLFDIWSKKNDDLIKLINNINSDNYSANFIFSVSENA